MKRTLLAGTGALCLALSWSLRSSAQRAHAAELRIDWTAPPECPTARDLRMRVMNLLDSVPHPSLLATIEVTRSAQGYRAHVVLRGPSGFGERRLEDARCDVLVDSVAVLLALSIPSPASSDTERALSLVLRPEARVSSGPLPLPAAGVGAAIAVEGLASFRLELHGGYYVPQSTTFEQTTLGSDFQLLTVGACICRLWSLQSVQWGPCLGAEVHHVSASGFGGVNQRPGSTTFWGPSLQLFARAQLSPMFGISVAIEGAVPITRPQFVFSDVGPLHRVGAVALQASVGPEVRF
jgi:hypothetical protein